MRLKMLAILLVFAVFSAQTISAVAQVAVTSISPMQATPAAAGNLTIPAGKTIPLTLVSPIKNKSTRVGDTVRAQVAFPITIDGRIAIPAGTYVEGTVQSIQAKKTKTKTGGLQIHFTRLIFANGYTVALDAVNTASIHGIVGVMPASWQTNAGAGAGIGLATAWLPVPVPALYAGGQTPTPAPTLPPLPGPPKAFLVSVAIAGALMIAFFAYLITASHHASNSDFVVYDAGYQFQMVTSNAVTVDAAQVSAAAAVPSQ